MPVEHAYPLSQRKPYCQGADFQYAYMDTCRHSTQDRYILKAGRILGCSDGSPRAAELLR